MAELSSLPLLKAKYLLAMAAPASEGSSLEEPAEGYVRETVEVRADGSVTMVRPVFRVVMEGVKAGAAPGVVDGSLFFRCKDRKWRLVFVTNLC